MCPCAMSCTWARPTNWKEATREEDRDLGMIYDKQVETRTQCATAANTAQTILGQITRAFHFRLLQLYKPQVYIFGPTWKRLELSMVKNEVPKEIIIGTAVRKNMEVKITTLGFRERSSQGLLLLVSAIFSSVDGPCRCQNYLARSFLVTSPTTSLSSFTTTRCRRPRARNCWYSWNRKQNNILYNFFMFLASYTGTSPLGPRRSTGTYPKKLETPNATTGLWHA